MLVYFCLLACDLVCLYLLFELWVWVLLAVGGAVAVYCMCVVIWRLVWFGCFGLVYWLVMFWFGCVWVGGLLWLGRRVFCDWWLLVWVSVVVM